MPVKRIPISEIRRAPIRHEQLHLVLVQRIRDLQEDLDEGFPKPLDNWLDEFKRDPDPESEVRWWEGLAGCYLRYVAPKEFTLEQKRAAFKVLFMLCMGGDMQSVAEVSCLPESARA